MPPDNLPLYTPLTISDEAAFPTKYGIHMQGEPGLTKREYFAAMALIGLAANPALGGPKDHARVAVAFADALIAKLNETN